MVPITSDLINKYNNTDCVYAARRRRCPPGKFIKHDESAQSIPIRLSVAHNYDIIKPIKSSFLTYLFFSPSMKHILLVIIVVESIVHNCTHHMAVIILFCRLIVFELYLFT